MVENQVVLLSWEMRFFAQVFVYVTPLLHEFLMDFAFFPRNQFMILTFFFRSKSFSTLLLLPFRHRGS
jgi:hypothetical protein